MKVGYWVLTLAVLAMVLSPGVASGDVLVLLDFEGTDTYDDVWDWTDEYGDTEIPTTSDAPEGSTTASTWPISEGEILRYWETSFDASSYSYMNVYVKFSADPTVDSGCWLGIESDANENGWGIWIEPLSDLPNFAVGEWFYVSISFTDPDSELWGSGYDFTETDSVVTWFEKWEGDPIDVFVDYVTLSGTPEEGMLGAPPPEVGVTISGAHILDVGDALVLEATAEGFDEGETYQWSKDGGDLGGETGDTLTIDPVDADDSGTYSVSVEGLAGGEAASDEASFLVMVGYATPVAGGLGLGLMAGACALAGVVAIRRKK